MSEGHKYPLVLQDLIKKILHNFLSSLFLLQATHAPFYPTTYVSHIKVVAILLYNYDIYLNIGK